jgi:uncharacterized phage protein (TIGR01671 family)
MREIKFRGKRRLTGQWVFGLIGLGDRGEIDQISGFGNSENQNQFNTFRVYHETIGQYTGLKDREGKEVFEGDLVQEYIMEDIFEVAFTDYANFGLKPVSEKVVKYLKGHEYETIDPSYASTSLTVIGNIHDNHDLLTPPLR